jgi:hypothetical protein
MSNHLARWAVRVVVAGCLVAGVGVVLPGVSNADGPPPSTGNGTSWTGGGVFDPTPVAPAAPDFG